MNFPKKMKYSKTPVDSILENPSWLSSVDWATDLASHYKTAEKIFDEEKEA